MKSLFLVVAGSRESITGIMIGRHEVSPLDAVGGGDNEPVRHNGAPAVQLLPKLDAHSPGVRAGTGLLAVHNPPVSLRSPAI